MIVLRSITLYSILIIMLLINNRALTQDQPQQGFMLETEPVAYALGGAGFTAAYQSGAWIYSVETFGGLRVPESLHGNEGFSSSLKGIIFQAERFLSGTDGFYLGPEFGISRPRFTLESSGQSTSYTSYSLGIRAGYHWNTGLGRLYLSPVIGIGYPLNARDVEISDNTFESGPVMPWGTVGIGWTF